MLACQRHLFSLPPGEHYLNCAYMGPLPVAAQEAGIEGIRRKAIPSRIRTPDFFEDSDRVRALFARLLGVSAERIALQPGVSYGVSSVARNVRGRPGQNVVIAAEQFPGNVYAWRRLCREQDLELRAVAAPDSARRGEEWNAALLDAIDERTAAVALPHVHWTDGTRFDLERIGERARTHAAVFVADLSQSLGAMPFDFQRIRPDAVVCAAYKWLLGPYSLALAYYGERFDDGVPLEETWIAREGSEDFQALVDYRDEYGPGAVRFDCGERSNFILLPMLAASLELILEWTPERVQEYCAHLMRDVIGEARSIGFLVEDESWRGAHLFGIRMPAGLDLRSLQEALVRAGVSASLRGSALRVAPNVYNDSADAAALREVLRRAVIPV
jgi:selenocysteine lyase/cysteine desulfurase